jgi:hypothetical protein
MVMTDKRSVANRMVFREVTHNYWRDFDPPCARFATFRFCSGCDTRLHPPVRPVAAMIMSASPDTVCHNNPTVGRNRCVQTTSF